MLTLRPYQAQAVADLRQRVREGYRRVLLQAPTGAGKTVITSEIIRSASLKGSVTWYLAHQAELIEQASEKLRLLEVPHGVILPGHYPDSDHPVYVGTIQSFTSRSRRGRLVAPPPDLIIIDEAHHALSDSYRNLIEGYPHAVTIGATATPIRTDGRGLGHLFDDLVQTPNIAQLIEQGYLVPPRYYAPYRPDLSGVHTRMGDYVEEELVPILDKPELVGDIVQWWLKLAAGRQTIVFGVSVGHSVHLAEQFQDAGISAVHLDGQTALAVRKARIQEFRQGRIQVLCNYGIAIEGVDIPEVSCIVIARATKSVKVYLQMAGRGLRTAPGKANCLILDHAGVVYEHGPITDWLHWRLDTTPRAGVVKAPGAVSATKRTRTCPQCSHVFWGQKVCPACGYTPQVQRQAHEPLWVDGDLVELQEGGIGHLEEDRQEFFQQLLYIGKERGYKPGWAAAQYKNRFGDWPPRDWNRLPPMQPAPATLEYVRRQQQRYWVAKRKVNHAQV